MFGIISIVFAVVCMARRPETNVTDQYDCPFITSGKDTEIEVNNCSLIYGYLKINIQERFDRKWSKIAQHF